MGMSERDPVAAADDFRDALMRKAKDLSDDVLLHRINHLSRYVLSAWTRADESCEGGERVDSTATTI